MTVSNRIRNRQCLLSFHLLTLLLPLLASAAHRESVARRAISPGPRTLSCSSAPTSFVKSTCPALLRPITVPSQRSLVSFLSIRSLISPHPFHLVSFSRLHHFTGNCWRALPLEEKRVWEVKAKHAKAEHKQMYPNYRFRPVHNKNKERKPKATIPAEDEKRCEDVAQLLLEGMKGEELAAAVKRLDHIRSNTPLNLPRRPSSVPLPHSFPISIPALPFVDPSRPSSPQCMIPPRYTLPRRPSSAAPSFYRSWTEPFNIPREPSPMPEINASLFNGSYLDNAFPGSSTQMDASFVSFSFSRTYRIDN
jgi:hypothetical protein